jgi:transposase
MLGDEAAGIISADRFSSYKAMTADGRFRVAYCWAHVRRDFVELIPQKCHRKWAIDWIDRIAFIYKLNDQRVAALNTGNMLAFQIANQTLAYQLCLFALCFTVQAMAADVYSEKQLEILRSLESHWKGLTVFHEYPEVPMDNNQAERELRGLVVGRKCYYGSGAVWSGELAAKLYSIFRTLNIWRINPQAWLTSYLDTCAKAGGNAPAAAHLFLPWNMDAARKRELGIGARDSIEFPPLTG